MVFAIFKTYDHSDDLVHGGGGDTGQAFAGLLKREKKYEIFFGNSMYVVYIIFFLTWNSKLLLSLFQAPTLSLLKSLFCLWIIKK